MTFVTGLFAGPAEIVDPLRQARTAVPSTWPGKGARIGCDGERCERYAFGGRCPPGDPDVVTTPVVNDSARHGDGPIPPRPEPGRPSFWSELSPSDQRDLLRLGPTRVFLAGAALLRQNDPSNHVLLLRSGCVKVVSHSDDGYYVVLGIRDAGDIVGEMSSLVGEPRSASVYAIRDVEALVMPAGWFNAFVRSHSDAAVALHWSLCARLREADRCRKEAAIRSVEQRLAALLLDLAGRYGTTGLSGGAVLIDLPLSQDDLAGLILASRRTLGRALMRLRTDNVVVTGRRTILVKDPAALRALRG